MIGRRGHREMDGVYGGGGRGAATEKGPCG